MIRLAVASAVLLAGAWWLLRAAETVEAVLARFVQATGGHAAYEKIRNRVVHATMEIARQGIRLELTVYAAKPNLFYMMIINPATSMQTGLSYRTAY